MRLFSKRCGTAGKMEIGTDTDKVHLLPHRVHEVLSVRRDCGDFAISRSQSDPPTTVDRYQCDTAILSDL
jgi:hypothetical protein